MTDETGTRHLIDPELLPVLDFIPTLRFSRETLPAIRADLAQQFAPPADLPIRPVVKVASGPESPIDIVWFDPSPGSHDRAALLYIHGGGMVIGSAHQMTHMPAMMAKALQVPVASVEYRLAPNTPFPGPQEDCYAALAWLADNATELGIDPARIAVTGDSAGGGLAAAVAQIARDRGGPKLAAQILVYPMLDHRVGGASDPWRNPHSGEFVWTRESNQFGWDSMRGDYRADDTRRGWFSPALAEDLTGLPPTWIGVGNLDLFFDEDLDYARRLVSAGVAVELHTYPGAFHGFNALPGTRLTRDFTRDLMSGTARLLGLTPLLAGG